jgi:hypothetical protein
MAIGVVAVLCGSKVTSQTYGVHKVDENNAININTRAVSATDSTQNSVCIGHHPHEVITMNSSHITTGNTGSFR